MTAFPTKVIDLCKQFEGLHRLKKDGLVYPYICPAGYWTIGYGHLCDKNHRAITQQEAELYLIKDLQKSLDATLRYCPGLASESSNKLAAIVDFTFNLGAGRLQMSTLRRRINQKDWDAAEKELMKWVYGGGRVLLGLVLRRKAEAELLRV